MKSIKLLFSRKDTKRKRYVNQRDLNSVLKIVCQPFKVTSNHITALMRVFGNPEQDQFAYEKFTGVYLNQTLRKKLDYNDSLRFIVDKIEEFQEKKPLVSVFIKVDERKLQSDENYKFEI